MQIFSKLFIFTGVFISIGLYSQVSPYIRNDPAGFSPPLDIPLLLSGNYGEIRTDHFHAGIDIKTEQVEGKMVYAASSGYVFRIVVQSGGYGHALYIRDDDGRVTVYGHLRQFVPLMDDWVKNQQYHKKSFEVDLNPRYGQFTFHQGELIGFSGNTGASGGPHLHFEIRDKSATIPLNVLKYAFPIRDEIKPAINWLSVNPMDDSSTVNGVNQKVLLQVTGTGGSYYPVENNLSLSGNIGFGIETFDFLDNSDNPCSPYEIRLYEDNRLHFCFVLDSIPFSLSGYMNSHIDYEEKLMNGRLIQKLFLDPNNRLPIYKVSVNRGVIRFSDTLQHLIRVSVLDAYGNESQLLFNVHSAGMVNPPVVRRYDSAFVTRFYYNRMNVFEKPDIKLMVPAGALFDNLNFTFSREKSDTLILSDIFNIHQMYVPLNKSYTLSIKPLNLVSGLHNKAMIVSMGKNGARISYGGVYKDGFVTAQVKNFGRFFIAVDTMAPLITPENFLDDTEYSEGQTISFRVTDQESGIRKYSGYVDKKWALFEYDAKNDLLSYTIDRQRLAKGEKHIIEIMVADKRDNVSHFRGNFFFSQ